MGHNGMARSHHPRLIEPQRAHQRNLHYQHLEARRQSALESMLRHDERQRSRSPLGPDEDEGIDMMEEEVGAGNNAVLALNNTMDDWSTLTGDF